MATVRTPENKNQLIIDEGAAETVRQIFSWKLDGMSAQAIADQLNSKGVLSPMEYKKSIGLNFKTSFKLNKMAKWTAVAVLPHPEKRTLYWDNGSRQRNDAQLQGQDPYLPASGKVEPYCKRP